MFFDAAGRRIEAAWNQTLALGPGEQGDLVAIECYAAALADIFTKNRIAVGVAAAVDAGGLAGERVHDGVDVVRGDFREHLVAEQSSPVADAVIARAVPALVGVEVFAGNFCQRAGWCNSFGVLSGFNYVGLLSDWPIVIGGLGRGPTRA